MSPSRTQWSSTLAQASRRQLGATRVMTYNLADFTHQAPRAHEVLDFLAPDVLCLQEVPRRLFGARRVASFLRRDGLAWAGPHRGSGGTTIAIGAAHTLVSLSHHRLGVRWPDRTRGFAVARVADATKRELTAVSVHLSLKPSERVKHIQAVLERVPRERTVLCGDFNEAPDGAVGDQLRSAGFRLGSPEVPSYPNPDPVHILDGIWLTPDLATVEPVPGVAAALPHGLIAATEAASDHRPVWLDLQPPS